MKNVNRKTIVSSENRQFCKKTKVPEKKNNAVIKIEKFYKKNVSSDNDF